MTVAIFSLLVAFLHAQPAPAEPPAQKLILSQVLKEARDKNPEIKAARSNWEAAQAWVVTEKTWKPPQVGVEYWGFTAARVGSAPEKWYDVGQEVPFPGKLRFKGVAAAHQARREEEFYKGVELDVLAKVKSAYYRYLFTVKAKRILVENVDVMRRFAKIAESKYATGKTSQSDVLRAQVELTKTLGALLLMEQERDTTQAKLNALLDRPPEEPLGLPEEPPLTRLEFSYQELEQTALAQRPEVRAAGHHIGHMRSSLAAARADYLPDFMLQYSRRARDGMPDDSIGMIKMSLPFAYLRRQNAQTRAVKAELGHAEAMLRSEENSARSDVKEKWTQVQTIWRLVDLYRTSVLPQAEQSVEVTQSAYQAERIDFLNLLDSQRALLEFKLDYHQYVSQYGRSLAELERVLGVEPASFKSGAAEEHSHDR